MTSKQRVLDALNHKETDRVPLMYRDIPEVRLRLKKDLNCETDERLFELFNIDFRWVEPTYVGNTLVVENDYKRDIWGVEWKYTNFNDNAGYWNEIGHPLKDIEDLSVLEDYSWPSIEEWDFSKIEKDCDKYKDYAIMTAPGPASPGIFQYPIQTLIGAEESFMKPLTSPEFFKLLVEKVVSFQEVFIGEIFKAGNGKIDFFRIGDDFGTQQSLFMGVQMWEDLFLESYKRMVGAAKKYRAFYYQHSCGAIKNLIPSFIKAGVDVIDPLQITATGMDPKVLKKEFGDVLTFSGGIDEQYILPNGTPQQVKDEVKRMVEIMGCNGGYILGPTHNFQDDIPTANIVAMYEAANEL